MNPMTNRTEEIDECTLMPNMCNHGTCVNTPGSFHCSCDGGYVYDANSHQCIGEIALWANFGCLCRWLGKFFFQTTTNVCEYQLRAGESLSASTRPVHLNVSVPTGISWGLPLESVWVSRWVHHCCVQTSNSSKNEKKYNENCMLTQTWTSATSEMEYVEMVNARTWTVVFSVFVTTDMRSRRLATRA